MPKKPKKPESAAKRDWRDWVELDAVTRYRLGPHRDGGFVGEVRLGHDVRWTEPTKTRKEARQAVAGLLAQMEREIPSDPFDDD